jgi:hypothetical protein
MSSCDKDNNDDDSYPAYNDNVSCYIKSGQIHFDINGGTKTLNFDSVTVIVSASIKDFILSDTVVFFRGMGNSDNDIIDGGWFTATHKDLTVKKTQRKDIVITVKPNKDVRRSFKLYYNVGYKNGYYVEVTQDGLK